ncbi:uncharacterized protein LOC135950635 [Calliphora vicina]|uniref:uncharacterized protein LOC135950635 n=1 Tax=Calliphora vicina TaxID=7373 RepID=UPI00325B90FD
MSKIIEIIDSDDDNHTPTDTPSTSIESSINSMEPDDNLNQSQSRRRRRKSVLHAMNDPDMHFLTISLEDDDDEVEANNSVQSASFQNYQSKNPSGAVAPPSRTLLKTPRTAPKILAPKAPTTADIVDAHFDKFLNDPETISDVYAIAEERARINYLLSVNGMPEINFTLYTRPERLQFQFEERLKQRKMVHNWDNARLQENRRSLLQKTNEQNTT